MCSTSFEVAEPAGRPRSVEPGARDHTRPRGSRRRPRGLRIGVLTELGAGFGADDRVLSVVEEGGSSAAGRRRRRVGNAAGVPEDPYPALDRLFQVRAATELESIRADLRRPGASGDPAVVRSRQHITAPPTSPATVRRWRRRPSGCGPPVRRFDYVIAPVIPTVGFAAEDCGLDPAYPLAPLRVHRVVQPDRATGQRTVLRDAQRYAGRHSGDRPETSPTASVLRLTKWLESNRPVTIEWPTPVAAVSTGGGS